MRITPPSQASHQQSPNLASVSFGIAVLGMIEARVDMPMRFGARIEATTMATIKRMSIAKSSFDVLKDT